MASYFRSLNVVLKYRPRLVYVLILSLICLIVSLTLVSLFNNGGYKPFTRTINGNMMNDLEPKRSVKMDLNLVSREQKRRIQHIRDACSDSSVFAHPTYKGGSSLQYHYSRKYNFNYCKVPKVGCSFWVQMFTILTKGPSIAQLVFKLPRFALHGVLQLTNYVTFETVQRWQSRTVLVARDPYSRLYSAFIDKIYLHLNYEATSAIIEHQRNIPKELVYSFCPNNITFLEFLNEIIDTANAGYPLNRHWAPIVSLCNPCYVNPFVLVKQESFASDVEYTLKVLRVADDEYEAIYNALHSRRIEVTIPALVETILLLSYSNKKCWDEIEAAKEIWISLQIQGYIRDDIAFPYHIVNSAEKASSPAFLSELIIKTIRENPLTSGESSKQRRRALVKAYNSIKKTTIGSLKQIYKQDFILFNYSMEPPSE